MEPRIAFHLAAGVIGLLSGATALAARKGSRLHRTAGTVFLIAMLTTAGSGALFGLAKGRINDAIAGILTLYLLATGWMAVRRRPGETGLFERGAFLFAAAMAVIAFYSAIVAVRSGTAMLGGIPYLVFASIVSMAAALDLNAILRGGLSGRQRVARHLWRLHLGFAAAVGSFFPGQIDFFPDYVRSIRPMIILFAPPLVVVGLMLFWLARVRFSDGWRDPA
jgi:hypothetical protein